MGNRPEKIYTFSENPEADGTRMSNKDKAALLFFMFEKTELHHCFERITETIDSIWKNSDGMQKWDQHAIVTWELWHQCAGTLHRRICNDTVTLLSFAEGFASIFEGTEGMVAVHALMEYASSSQASWRFKCMVWSLFDYYPLQRLIDRDLIKYANALEIAEKTKQQRSNEFDFEEIDDMRIGLLRSTVEDLQRLRK